MKNIKEYTSIVILIFINFIFIYKYSSRVSNLSAIIALSISAILFFTFFLKNKIKVTRKILFLLTGCTTIAIIIVNIYSYLYIPVEVLNVDRWSIMSSFITEFLNGNYPYYGKSNVGNPPGPMPIYYFIALPFYFIGEYSLLSSLGYLGIIYLFVKKYNQSKNNLFICIYYLLSSSMYWEIATRSNIFTFTILVTLTLNLYLMQKNNTKLNFIISGLLCGFALCTRSATILAYIIFFIPDIYSFKRFKVKRPLLFIGIAIIGFILPFLPLLILFYEDFWTMNPFLVQSSFFLPSHYILVFILIAVSLSFLIKSNIDKFFYSGVSLFITILIYSIYHLINSGYQESFVNSKVDISYFIFSIPFLTTYLIQEKDEIT